MTTKYLHSIAKHRTVCKWKCVNGDSNATRKKKIANRTQATDAYSQPINNNNNLVLLHMCSYMLLLSFWSTLVDWMNEWVNECAHSQVLTHLASVCAHEYPRVCVCESGQFNEANSTFDISVNIYTVIAFDVFFLLVILLVFFLPSIFHLLLFISSVRQIQRWIWLYTLNIYMVVRCDLFSFSVFVRIHFVPVSVFSFTSRLSRNEIYVLCVMRIC